MAVFSTTKPKKQIVDVAPIEAMNRVGSAVTTLSKDVSKFTKEETKENMRMFWEQLLGVESTDKSKKGEMAPGQEISFAKAKQAEQIQQEAKPAIRAAYDYGAEILRVGEKNVGETKQLENKLTDVIGELKRLATASAVLEKEVIEATGQTIVNPGKYHINFFEWLLIEVRQARMQVENAGAWLATVKSKHGKKKNYWEMYKEHGTKFGLSGERSVSTQTA